jgi:hypothetical protein
MAKSEAGSEASGLEQAPRDVVGQVAEAKCGSAEVLESAMGRLGRPVAGAPSVEVGNDVGGAELLGGGGLEAGEPVHCDDLDGVSSGL